MADQSTKLDCHVRLNPGLVFICRVETFWNWVRLSLACEKPAQTYQFFHPSVLSAYCLIIHVVRLHLLLFKLLQKICYKEKLEGLKEFKRLKLYVYTDGMKIHTFTCWNWIYVGLITSVGNWEELHMQDMGYKIQCSSP